MSPTEILYAWLASFEKTLADKDLERLAAHFYEECFWRDMLAFTWNIVTLEGLAEISHMLVETLDDSAPRNWRLDGPVIQNEEMTEAWIRFDTRSGSCKGYLRLKDNLCFTLLTTLHTLWNHSPTTGSDRPRGVEHGAFRGRPTWQMQRQSEISEIGNSRQPFCVIIGAGQGGLALAARLRHLEVPTLIVEKNERIGDSWRNRYDSLCLHDPVWYDHMPYLPFPEGWPVFTPKEKMGDWLEMYATVMELDCWTGTECKNASFNAETGLWDVSVDRRGQIHVLNPRHLVFATGMSGYPHIPEFRGQNRFEGRQLHSSQFKRGLDFRDKRCVVIGSNTSAHDICADLWEAGVDVVMVQRSGTFVARAETVLELVLGPLFSHDALESGIDTETADYMVSTWPYRLLEQRQKDVCSEMRERDHELHNRLEVAGFILDFEPDETGMVLKSFRQAGGFYIDFGASDLICRGEIGLKSGVEILELDEAGLVLSDGTDLDADVIIYATGYSSMNDFVADIVSQDVADKVGKCWGLGSGTKKDPGPWQGELRNMWKPTQQEGLWFQGGNLAQCRHYSHFLALQIKARMESIPTPVYALAPVYHKR